MPQGGQQLVIFINLIYTCWAAIICQLGPIEVCVASANILVSECGTLGGCGTLTKMRTDEAQHFNSTGFRADAF
jgi:hypothetical protein